MTETPRPPVLLTPEYLRELRYNAESRGELAQREFAELFDYIESLEAALQAARAERDKAQEALITAARTIRALHGIGLDSGTAEMKAWTLYQASPEMKQINAALAATDYSEEPSR